MVVAEAADALGEQAGDSLDQIVRTALVAGGSVQYAGSATATNEITAAMTLGAAEVLEAQSTLKTNKAVAPLGNGKYPVIIHPHAEYDCLTDPTWQAILLHSRNRGDGNSPFENNFLGEAFGMEFYVSANAYYEADAGSGNVDVYHALILGKGSFGVGGMASYMPGKIAAMRDGNNTYQKVRPLSLIDHDFGEAGSADPLNQRASLGWYTTFAVKVLDANFYVRIEHAATLGSNT